MLFSKYPEEAPLDVFIHVPKTAGTSLRSVIAENYGADKTWCYQETARGFFPANTQLLASEQTGQEHALKPLLAKVPKLLIKAGVHLMEKRATPAEVALAHAAAAVGHLSLKAFNAFIPERSAYFFTVVREPLARMVSHYRYVRQNRSLPGEVKGWQAECDPDLPFADFALTSAVQNFQTKYTGTDTDTYARIGTTENFSDFLQEMKFAEPGHKTPRLRQTNAPLDADTSCTSDPGFQRDFQAFHAEDYVFYEKALTQNRKP